MHNMKEIDPNIISDNNLIVDIITGCFNFASSFNLLLEIKNV